MIAPGTQGSAKIVPVEFNNFQGGLAASWELDVFGVEPVAVSRQLAPMQSPPRRIVEMCS